MPFELVARNGLIALNNSFVTGSLNVTSGITGSLFGTSSWAIQALTASSADNFNVRGTLTATTLVVQTITSSINFVTGSTRFGNDPTNNTHQFSGSVTITGSLSLNGGVGTINATASWAARAVSASIADNAVTASRALSANTASFATSAANATSASFATSAANATSASIAANAVTASFALNSQNAFVQGGNSFGVQALLGTNDLQNLALETNGTVRMTISGSNGFVGIGVATPATLLGLAGSTSPNFGLSLQPSGWNNARHRFTVPTSGDTSMWSFNWDGSVIDSALYSVAAINVTQGVISFSTTGSANAPTERMRITSGGNVGIGTTSAVGKLTVSSSLGDQIRLDRTGQTSRAIVISGGDNFSFGTWASPSQVSITPDGNVGINTTSPNGSLEINRNISFSTIDTFAQLVIKTTAGALGNMLNIGVDEANGVSFIQSVNRGVGVIPLSLQRYGGNVGIGTTSPVVALDFGNATGKALHLYTSGVDYYGINMAAYDGSTFSTNIFSGDGGLIKFRTASGTSTQTTRMTINAIGNVGIGTASPRDTLDVFGSIVIRSGYNLSWGNTYGAGVPTITGESGSAAYLAFYPAGSTSSERVRIDANGNVGIGITAPTAMLHIANPVGGNDGLVFQKWAYTAGTTGVYELILKQTVTSGVVRYNFSMINASTAYNDVLVLDRGNVGIGTTSPGYKLDVNSDSIRFGDGGSATLHMNVPNSSGVSGNINVGGSPRITIQGTGNVGIGTTSPSARLTVENAGVVAININDNSNTQIPTINFQQGGTTKASIEGGVNLSSRMDLSAGGTRIMTLIGGNVGINTTSPTFSNGNGLVVHSEGASRIKLSNPTSGQGATDGFEFIMAGVDAYVYNYEAGPMIFGAGNAERMRILSNGNIGIGTTDTQTFRLAVDGPNVGQGDTTTTIRVFDTTSATTGTGGGISFAGYFSGTSSIINTFSYIKGGKENSTAGDYASYLSFGTRVNGGGATERMRITSGGNVGIGTTAPGHRLSVVGQGTGIMHVGDAGFGSNNYTGISLNGTLSTTAYNFLSSTSDISLYINRPSGGSIRFRETNSDQMVISAGGNVGINTSSPSFRLDVSGDIRATGDVIAFSDTRVKENINTITNALTKVTSLRGVTYTRNDSEDKSTKIGVIAQEVLPILPEVVQQDNNGNYSVAYGNIVGVLIEAIKELKAEIDQLKNK